MVSPVWATLGDAPAVSVTAPDTGAAMNGSMLSAMSRQTRGMVSLGPGEPFRVSSWCTSGRSERDDHHGLFLVFEFAFEMFRIKIIGIVGIIRLVELALVENVHELF